MDTIEEVLANPEAKPEKGKVGDMRYLLVRSKGESQWVPIVDIYQDKIVTVRGHLDDRDYDLKFWIHDWEFGDEYCSLNPAKLIGDSRVGLFYNKRICEEFQEKYFWTYDLPTFIEDLGVNEVTLEQLRIVGLILGMQLPPEKTSKETPEGPFYQQIRSWLQRTPLTIPKKTRLATGAPVDVRQIKR